MSRILPTSRAAARRFPLQASNRWQPPPSVALLSTSQPLCDKIRQAHPRGAYYDLLLTSPPPYAAVKSEEPPTTAKSAPATPKTPVPVSASSSSSTPTKPETVSERARIVFGSRLAGPAERAERLARIRDRSQMIAGVLVPPQPEEPENCCMSGCVDCVWDRYRDEIEGWAQASAEASRRLQAQESGVAASVGTGTSPAGVATTQGRTPQPGAVSMDDDGGGSNTNWDLGPPTVSTPVSSKGDKDFWDDELYKGLPVGIREFMKQEKRLKLKHIREGTLGG
ncbi:hypothetical protein CMQ_7467 [Grosmannia clavigera kw1407]|uniref:Oxidoreductase-like domain-containing protein n=1 Tax=Grosmannia clavigera (strain kw1407 / UAMH 11150) TaxID=655863 RepID=F0XNP3_GROCL|nr:uncharacterized protein CMQ_7467 [Grosmannia clavigera kw1407]EFX00465.1 hypothetical protein CMQ_7467 [Grosmannia clavigera kw1407]